MISKLKPGFTAKEIKKLGKEFTTAKNRQAFMYYLRKATTRLRNCDGIYYKHSYGSYIYPNVVLGFNVDIQPGSVIGCPGFGYEKDKMGRWQHIPHIGRVIIGEDVSIGANNTIDCGTIGDTVIGDGCKFDNNIHIAHNCKIGKNVIICAGVTFCGSVTVEDDVWLAPGTLIKEGVTISKGARTGLGAVVTKNVAPGVLVFGVPAKEKKNG